MPTSCGLAIPGHCEVEIPLPAPVNRAAISIDIEENRVTTAISVAGTTIGRGTLTLNENGVVFKETVLGVTTKAHFVAHFNDKRLDVRLELRIGGRRIFNETYHGIATW